MLYEGVSTELTTWRNATGEFMYCHHLVQIGVTPLQWSHPCYRLCKLAL